MKKPYALHWLIAHVKWFRWRRRNIGPVGVPRLRTVTVEKMPLSLPLYGYRDLQTGGWVLFEPPKRVTSLVSYSGLVVLYARTENWEKMFNRGDELLVRADAGLRLPPRVRTN